MTPGTVLFMVLLAAGAVAQAQTLPTPLADAPLHAATQRAGDSHALQLTGDLAAHDPTLIRSRRPARPGLPLGGPGTGLRQHAAERPQRHRPGGGRG